MAAIKIQACVFVLFFAQVASATQPGAGCARKLLDAARVSGLPVVEHFQNSLLTQAREDLATLVAIPSVSDDPESKYTQSLLAGAQATARLLEDVGLENIQIEPFPGLGAPLVTANWLHAPDRPTILFYAHYDVVDAGEGWKSGAFELTERGGHFFGRGVTDNKGGVVAFATALRAFMQSRGTLPVNIKILIEGGEEIGADLTPFLEANRERFAADTVLIADAGNFNGGRPALTGAIKGYLLMDIRFSSSASSVHSGIFGGAVPNPVKELMRALVRLEGPQGLNLKSVPKPLSETIRPVDGDSDDQFAINAGLLPGVKPMENARFQVARLPVLNYTAIESDLDVTKTSAIPSTASTKIVIRNTPGMELDTVVAELKARFESPIENPYGMKVEITNAQTRSHPWRPDSNSLTQQIALHSLSEGFGTRAGIQEDGGAIPIVNGLVSYVGNDGLILYGLQDPDSAMHGANESLSIKTFHATIRSTIWMLESFGKTQGPL